MIRSFKSILEDNPIIAAVKNDDDLDASLQSEIGIIFILYGDICSIEGIVKKIKDSGSIAIVHLDLIAGLSSKEAALDFLKNKVGADGIITTKNSLVRHAKKLGLYSIVRYFVVDSMALTSIEKQMKECCPDAIEILPGIMPKIIKKVNSISRVPVISGGLIADKEDVVSALNAGAISISATRREIWNL